MVSEAKRKQLNASLPRGLFVDAKGRLRYKVRHQKKTYEKIIGPYSPGIVTEAKIVLGQFLDTIRLKRLGLDLPEEYLTMDRAVELVWQHHGSHKEGRMGRRYRVYLNTIAEFFGADRQVHTITVEDCRSFRAWCAKRTTRYGKPVTPSTVNKDHTILIALFNALERLQAEGTLKDNIVLPKRNPARFVPKAEKATHPTKPPTQDQYDALLKHADDNGIRRIILGAAITMRRKKELMEMNMDLVNSVAGVIRGRVSKGKTPDQDRFYTVPITNVIKMLIDTRPSNYLFNFANWPKRWERTLKHAGLTGKVQFRSLRKLGATQANLMGTDPRTIQDMLRHSSLEMTQVYVQMVPEALRQAAEKLDRKLGMGGRKVVNEVVNYTPRFKVPKYLKRIEKDTISETQNRSEI
jgi:integrase